MKHFIKLIQQVHEENYSTVFQKLFDSKIPVASFSIHLKDTVIDEISKLKKQGLNVSTCIVDNPPPTQLELDLNVVNIRNVLETYQQPEYIFTFGLVDSRIASKYFPSSKVFCNCMYSRGDKELYVAFMTHLVELQEVYQSLIDEESKRVFRGYWFGRISKRLNEIVFSNSVHYLIEGFIPEREAVVIDVGVFDGGTSAIFADMGYKVYGFEMDKKNYEKSLKVAEEKNFVLESFGLGSCKQTIHYTATGSAGSNLTTSGNDTAEIITLDSYVNEKKLSRVDFLKMDVEGAELEVLRGAVTTIARFKPILAISVYHKPDDFWTLMNFVKSIRSDYEFVLRQFGRRPETEPSKFNDLPSRLLPLGLRPEYRTFGECVLFAR